ncbi:hypothetical protein DTQ70_06405 [Runella sp. SP2]|nr:hypothetical protein DTQ70_06405 [Runella sp. SP2]
MQKWIKIYYSIVVVCILLYVLHLLFIELIFVLFSGSPNFPINRYEFLYHEVIPKAVSSVLCIKEIFSKIKGIIFFVKKERTKE